MALSHANIPPLSLSEQAVADAPDLQTSLLYQLFSAGPTHIPFPTLHLALESTPNLDVNETNAQGQSLLHRLLVASPHRYRDATLTRDGLLEAQSDMHGTMSLATKLLDRGANPWVKDSNGRDALDEAMRLMWWPLLDRLWAMPGTPSGETLAERRLTWLMAKDAAVEPLLHACASSDNATLTGMLLQQGMNPNATNEDGRTPLFLACSEGLVKQLLDAGADPLAKDPSGMSIEAYWVQHTSRAPTVKSMHRRLARAQTQRTAMGSGANASGLEDTTLISEDREQQLQALFELCLGQNKGAVDAFARLHKISGNERLTVDGQRQTLLSAFAERYQRTIIPMGATRSKLLSSAVVNVLLDRSSLTDSTSDPTLNAPLFSLWLSTIALGQWRPEDTTKSIKAGSLKALERVEQEIQKRFNWDEPQGMRRFFDQILPWAEHQATVRNEPVWCTSLAHGLARLTLGDWVSKNWTTNTHAFASGADERRRDPSLRHALGFEGRSIETFVHKRGTSWVGEQDEQGMSYFWRWASIAAGLYDKDTDHKHGSNPSLWTIVLRGQQGLPPAPLDGHALSTFLAVLSAHDAGHLEPFKGIVHDIVKRNVRQDGVKFLDQRLDRLKARHPVVGQDVEAMVLRQASATTSPALASAPPPRVRL